MTTIKCPRCQGKKVLDLDDIQKLELEEDILPGPCTYCNENGEKEYSEEDVKEVISKLIKMIVEMLAQDKSDKEIIEQLEKNGVSEEIAKELLEKTKTHSQEVIESESDKNTKSPIIKILFGIISVPFLVLISFLYVYITALNPFIYFNFIIWLFFGFLLIFPISILCSTTFSKILLSIVLSTFTIYLVYGMKSTVFFDTLSSAILDDGSLWIPKVYFGDLMNTLFSPTEYLEKLNFLLDYDTLNISRRPGMKSSDMGSGFTNFFRIIECLGIYVIPIFAMNKSKN